jgi:DNA-directed RNA polymerase specialized sigma24 family protein
VVTESQRGSPPCAGGPGAALPALCGHSRIPPPDDRQFSDGDGGWTGRQHLVPRTASQQDWPDHAAGSITDFFLPSDTGPRRALGSSTLDAEKLRRWTEFHEVVGRLPDDLRAVFDLLWYQELSQAEAAALLGIAVPTVKLRWMKARVQVQQALGGSPFDDTGPLG